MVEDSDIVKELKKREVVEFDDITTENIVKLPDERGGDFEDLVRIAKEYTSDRNIYKFGRSGLSHSSKFWRAVLFAYRGVPTRGSRMKVFLDRFDYMYTILMSTKKQEHAENFKDIASALLGFRGALEWREAGVSEIAGEPERKRKIDKILGK